MIVVQSDEFGGCRCGYDWQGIDRGLSSRVTSSAGVGVGMIGRGSTGDCRPE